VRLQAVAVAEDGVNNYSSSHKGVVGCILKEDAAMDLADERCTSWDL
jgi:hypothetical protein